MLSTSAFVFLSFFFPSTQAKVGGGAGRIAKERRGNEGMYVCTPTLLPPTVLSRFGPLGQSNVQFSQPLPYYAYMHLHACAPCRNVRRRRKTQLLSWREVAVKVCLLKESLLRVYPKGCTGRRSQCMEAAGGTNWLWLQQPLLMFFAIFATSSRRTVTRSHITLV